MGGEGRGNERKHWEGAGEVITSVPTDVEHDLTARMSD